MTEQSSEEQAKWAQYSGLINGIVFGLFFLLLVALVVFFIQYKREEGQKEQLRSYWDLAFNTQKEKTTTEERIAALEDSWTKVNGTPAHPFIINALAQAHFEMALSSEYAPARRAAHLDKAIATYKSLLSIPAWVKHPVHGAQASRGLALCYIQDERFEEAAKILEQAVLDYETHYLYPNMCYELARTHWIIAQQKGENGKLDEKHLKEARRYIQQALSGVGDETPVNPQQRFAEQYTWRGEAKLLRMLLAEPGPALKDGVVPPEPAKVENSSTEAAPEKSEPEPAKK